MNVFFRLLIPVATLFVITVLAMVATMFGDRRAPVVAFLDEYGGTLIAVEAAATVLLGILAMTVDRLRTLRETGSSSSQRRSEADVDETGT